MGEEAKPLVISESKLSALSLFSNCGVGDFGFHRAGFRFLVMAELESQRLEIALRNHSDAVGLSGDLRELWPGVVTAFEIKSTSSRLDLLAACPPCQGMSTARADRGSGSDPEAGSKDPRNLLVLPIASVAEHLGPRIIVIENVPSFLTRKVWHPETRQPISAARLLLSLLGKDYEVFPLLTDLADYGVPQTRKRAFLTLIRRDEPCIEFLHKEGLSPYPSPTHAKDHNGYGHIKLKDALTTFGLLELDAASEDTATSNHPLHFVPVWKDRRYAMVKAIPPNTGASAWQNDDCEQCGKVEVDAKAASCPACDSPLLRPVKADKNGYRLIIGFQRSSYRRMHPESPAATITTASGRIGSDRTLHPWANRVLSPLECALLQTIPGDFLWGDALQEYGTMAVRAMIGEAVPPLFTHQHGLRLAQLLQQGRADQLLKQSDRRCKAARRNLKAGNYDEGQQ